MEYPSSKKHKGYNDICRGFKALGRCDIIGRLLKRLKVNELSKFSKNYFVA